jgi:hypothetical protein
MRNVTSPKTDPVPLWIKLSYTLMVVFIVPIYWYQYGPSNLLWFSDIAMIVMVPALWMGSRLLASMMAISVLLLEIIWMLGFFSGGHLFTIADYMFDDTIALWLRLLSLFHFPMPAVIIYMLWKYGYDPQALKYQMVVAAIVLPVTRVFVPDGKNINWVVRPDFIPEMPLPLYLAGMWITLMIVVYLPSHYLFKRFFGSEDQIKNR